MLGRRVGEHPEARSSWQDEPSRKDTTEVRIASLRPSDQTSLTVRLFWRRRPSPLSSCHCLSLGAIPWPSVLSGKMPVERPVLALELKHCRLNFDSVRRSRSLEQTKFLSLWESWPAVGTLRIEDKGQRSGGANLACDASHSHSMARREFQIDMP